jgi:hypothetical protein
MANYLVIEDNKIINAIVADSFEIASEITGKEVIESTGPTPWIDWVRVDNEWIAPEKLEEKNTFILEE